MDDRVRSTLFLLACTTVAVAQPLPDGAIARLAVPAGGQPFTSHICAALSPDGKTVALTDQDGRLELWDIATGKRQRTLSYAGPKGTAPRWSPDGKLLFTGHARGLAIWDVTKPDAPPRVLASHLETSAGPHIVVSPDGRTVVAAWPFPMIVCWDFELGAERWRSHSGGGLAITPDGGRVVRGWFGQRFDFLDAATGQLIRRLGPDLSACKPMCSDQFALSPDGRYIAAWEERGVVVLRDARSGESLGRLQTLQKWGSALAFSPDGHWLATGGAEGDLFIWEVDTRQVARWRTGHTRPLTSIDFSEDGRRVLTAAGDLTAVLWDVASPARAVANPWSDLSSPDGRAGYAAVCTLARDADGPAVLRSKLNSVPRLDAAEADRLIAGLDADRHAVRERASRALADHGRAALPAMQAAIARVRSAEAAARLEKLIAAIPSHFTPTEVTHRRAVKAMSLAGTPAARELLREWAAGAPGAILTEEARAALSRLAPG
jgi:hypothetical protein